VRPRRTDKTDKTLLSVGDVTGTARAFAAKKGIGLVGDEELARLLAK
jgi:hypothetical protein